MNIEQIMEAIQGLASSQGFYERLYRRLASVRASNPDGWDAIVGELESQGFKSTLDVVLYFEQ